MQQQRSERYVCVHYAVLALKRKETYNALFIHDPRADHVLKIRFSIKNNEFMHYCINRLIMH